MTLMHYMAMEKDQVDDQTLHSLLGRASTIETSSPFNFDGLLEVMKIILEDMIFNSAATSDITVAIQDTCIVVLCRSMHSREASLTERTVVINSFETLHEAVSLEASEAFQLYAEKKVLLAQLSLL